MLIDSAVYGLIDNAYNLIFSISSVTLNNDVVEQIIRNMYILVGIFAFFRIALLLVNAIIDPEKLNEKGKGLPNILLRTIIMLVILVFLPILFEMAYEFQADVLGIKKDEQTGDIVENGSGNLIERLILGKAISNTSGKVDSTPGDNFKNAALSALITVDEEFTDGELQVPSAKNDWKGGYKSNENCTTKMCNRAINDWNEMYVKGNMNIKTLRNYISVNEKVENESGEKEKVYVYNYTVGVTTIAGGIIVYILLSFAIDIGIRVFQLAALEIVAPIFVTTFVDPQSASSGMFNRWLKEVGSTYANLFIRVACVSLLVLFASLLNEIEFFPIGTNSNWVKLFLMIGLLIFAKKAPKWLSDLLGIKGDGTGLWTPKKLKENMLGGSFLAGAAKGALGAGYATAKNLGHLARARNEARKKLKLPEKDPVLSKDGARARKRALYNEHLNDQAPGTIGRLSTAWNKAKQDLAKEKEEAKKAYKDAVKKAKADSDFQYGKLKTAGRIGNALLNGVSSFNAAAKADKLSGSLKVAKDNSNAFKEAKGLKGDSWFTKVGDKYKVFKADLNEKMYGNRMLSLDSADDEKVRRVGKTSLKDPNSILEKNWIGKMTHYEGAVRVWDEQVNGYRYGADSNERLAMIALKWDGATDIKLDANNKIVSYKDKNGSIVTVDKDEKKHNKIIKDLATNADSKMTAYGRAQIAKFSADLGTKLVTEFGGRQGDLTSIQERLSNVTATISDRIAKVFDNASTKIKELQASGQNELANQLLSEAENARNIVNNISYKSNGMISYDGETMSIDKFRSEVSGLSDGVLKNMLTSTLDFHTAAAIDYREYSDTQKRIEAIMPTAAGAKILFDFKTGLNKEDENGKYVVFDGNMSAGAEVNAKKANKHLDPLKDEEKKKGNLKEGDS